VTDDQKVLLGLGVSATIFFVRYIFPTTPKWVAWGGAAGAIVVILVALVPGLPPRLATFLLISSPVATASAAYLWERRKVRRAPKPPKAPSTLRDHFNQMSPLLSVEHQKTITGGRGTEETITEVIFKLFYDWEANSDFAAIYVSRTANSGPLISYLSNLVVENRDELHSLVSTGVTLPGDRAMSTITSKFTGRVYLYHENAMSLSELADAERCFKSRGLDVHFRGPEYAAVHKLRVN
jgi:hypothetical protein